jgi:hypothetical protein
MQSNWFDDLFGRAAEHLARPLSRRGMLKRAFDVTFKGSLIVLLGVSSARTAWAEACACSPARGEWCPNCPSGAGCPDSPYQLCKKVDGVPQDTACIHNSGAWNEDCGDGTCRTCTDCWTGSSNTSCTCRSSAFSCDPGPCQGGCGPECIDCGEGKECCGNECCI